jgi:hypothetical protein
MARRPAVLNYLPARFLRRRRRRRSKGGLRPRKRKRRRSKGGLHPRCAFAS